MKILHALALASSFPFVAIGAESFPADVPGVNVGMQLPAGFEASAVQWHPRLQRLFVASDTGAIASMEANGSLVTTWSMPGDCEALALAAPESDFLYIGIENPDSIVEWNLVTGLPVRTFDLTPWMTGLANKGLEGLAFRPDANDPEGGVFVAGKQDDGILYRFRLPIRSSATSTAVEFLGTWTPIPGRTDVRSVEYDAVADVFYLAWVDPNRISQVSNTGALLADWPLLGGKPEGLTVRGCELWIADDNGFPAVNHFTSFPSGAACLPIAADASHVSLAKGGTVTFALDAASPLQPGDAYFLLGSASGTTPLQLGLTQLPLVPDAYFGLMISGANQGPFERTFGFLDANGRAHPRLVVPLGLGPALAGLTLHHAWIGATAAGSAPVFASAALSLTLVP